MSLILNSCANGRNQAVAQNLKNVDADNQRFTKSKLAPVWRQGFPRPETDGTLIIPLRSGREKTLAKAVRKPFECHPPGQPIFAFIAHPISALIRFWRLGPTYGAPKSSIKLGKASFLTFIFLRKEFSPLRYIVAIDAHK